MPHPDQKQDLDTLEARLLAAKAKHEPKPAQVAVGALARGTRHAVEIAATTLVGAGFGFWLDRWLGTAPWMFLVFVLFGIGAGFWNLVRAVNVEAEAARKRAAALKEE